MRLPTIARAALLIAGPVLTAAAPPPSVPASRYDPREAFAPFDFGPSANAVRSGSGLPGPAYWQNHPDYTIQATLDPATHSIRGTVEIRYTNNSPDSLDVLWLQLDQNIYRPDSRGTLSSGVGARGNGITPSTAGMMLDSAEVAVGGGRFVSVQPLVSDTRAQLRLPTLLASRGQAIVRIAYHYTVPQDPWGGRTGWMPNPGGDIYSVAQWYPRMAVYDDIRGWDPLPYLQQEFYLEYGDFDYSLTLPANYVVAGSGELVNEAQVLPAAMRARLAQARNSDRTVMIRSTAEPFGSPSAERTWHFRMHDSRDVAFAASPAFDWDAARINLPGGRSALAESVYPPEATAWNRSTEYMKDAVERYSAKWYPYPWPAAINVAGPAAGMEYPGIVFDDITSPPKPTFWIAAHEIGHSWFPMIVGFNERRDAWMDEGFNTFIDVYESDEFNHGEYAPKRDSEYAPGGGNPVDEILPILADPDAPPILTRADSVIEKYRHPVTYFKSALGLVLLREQILGPERFDPAFRRFIVAWAFKHPKPADFFRMMQSETGEDLGWWWRGWYANNWQLDLAVTGIRQVPGGSAVRVETRDKLVMPVTLRVTFADGTRRDIRLPAETWIRQAATDVPVPGASPAVRAELDPDHKIPDRDRSNNLFQPR
ncbi:M1 family metallopeptidase [Sphingomonas sp.]|uniref:M1 family metallopeptidase n=1 Tax=Sphingomonas sp. TaxID=28214 RepID=UPI0025F79351|nr:M1 family metallopeptidase [Sphingomonas sp.]MBV9529100.1 M1 family metallopeptidase [Sphingomonas sp.]